jgi:hypothetical protein
MSCLLARGIHAGLADRGNPHFDILVRTEVGEFRADRVKTTRSGSFQWTAKDEWDPLLGFDKSNPDPHDISVLVAFNDQPPGPDTEVYMVPTAQLVEDLIRLRRHYHSYKNRDGSERKRSTQRVIRLDREKKPDNIAYAFRDDWADYHNAWGLIREGGFLND